MAIPRGRGDVWLRAAVAVAIAALMTIGVRGQVSPAPVLFVIDVSQATAHDLALLVELPSTLAADAETRIWTGLDDDPVTRFRLSFAEAFEIARGNATALQAARIRECADPQPSCGADLPVRARQTLDGYDDLARATIAEVTTAVRELTARDEPRPHRVVFATPGLLYRVEPRRETEALKTAVRSAGVTLWILDVSGGERSPGELTRLSTSIGGTVMLANAVGMAALSSALAGAERSRDRTAPGARRESSVPKLPPEVERASRHAVAFAQSAETLLADEHYVQEVKTRPTATALSTDPTTGITIDKRELDSEVALVQLRSGELWLMARDVQRVDGLEVGPAMRIPLPVIREPSDADAIRQFREIAVQGARFNIGGIQRDLNVPTLALWLLTPLVNARLNYSVGNIERIDGVEAVVVKFKERKAPYFFHAEGRQAPVSGRFWLDRSRGAVIRTELILQSDASRPNSSRAVVVVNYGLDAKAEAWVPLNMTERYYAGRNLQFVVAQATYSNVRRFATSGRIVK